MASCLVLSLLSFLLAPLSYSQVVTTSITPDGSLGSVVTLSGTIHDITGGTRPDGGANLFHSFEQFNLGTGGTASFNGPSGIENILSRVTGGIRSNIDGTLRSTIDGANLFFLNPAGIVFGPNASLDISGSFHVSTADYVRLGEGENAGRFSATNPANDLLTTAPPTAFGFLGTNSLGNTADARVKFNGANSNASQLTVPGPGNVLSVIGRDAEVDGLISPGVDVSATTLEAENGRVNLASVGAHQPTELGLTEGLGVQEQTASQGVILLTDQTVVSSGIPPDLTVNDIPDVIGTDPRLSQPIGPIVIRGGQLIMENSRLVANTANGQGASIDIQITSGNTSRIESTEVSRVHDHEVSLSLGSSITADTLGKGTAGGVNIEAEQIEIRTTSVVTSNTSGEGNAGPVTITADNSITIADSFTFQTEAGPTQVTSAVTSAALGRNGAAGEVILKAPIITVSDAGQVSTSNDVFGGPAGNIVLEGQAVIISEGAQVTSSTFSDESGGAVTINASTSDASGSVTIEGRDSEGNASRVSTVSTFDVDPDTGEVIGGNGRAGEIVITADFFNIKSGGELTAATQLNGAGGNVTISSANAVLEGGAFIFSDTFLGSGNGGTVTVTAKESLLITGVDAESGSPTRIANGSLLGTGNAGIINLAASDLTVTNGAEITTSTFADGNAGDIVLEGDRVQLTNGSLINSSTFFIDNSSFPSTGNGNAGDVTVSARNSIALSGRSLGNDPTIIASASAAGASGHSGSIQLKAPKIAFTDGAQIFTTSQGIGDAGSVRVQADQLNLNNNVLLESSNTSEADVSGNAGSVTIEEFAGSSSMPAMLSFTDSIIRTNANVGVGGTISISSPADIQLVGTSVSAQVLDGTNAGGGISIISGLNSTLSLISGTEVSAQSQGEGNAGDINVEAGDTIILQDSTIRTFAERADGGDIKLIASDSIQLTDSLIISSVGGGPSTVGGNINLDPEFILLNNSEILAQAGEGQGGQIQLTADVVLADPFSNISASAGPAGIDGSVSIQAPIQNLSGTIAPLPEGLVKVAQFYASRCFAQKGGNLSSFVYHQVPSLPIQPGDFMNSQIAWGDVPGESIFSGNPQLPIAKFKDDHPSRIFDFQPQRFSSLRYSSVIQGC